jgi:uncharacterized repeat protein (TIGR01451 family)
MLFHLNMKNFATTLTWVFALSLSGGVFAQAQDGEKVIRLVSPDQPTESKTAFTQLDKKRSEIPKTDSNTSTLRFLPKQKRAEGTATPAVFALDADRDPSMGFTERTGFTIQEGEMPHQGGLLICPTPRASMPVQQQAPQGSPDARALKDEYIYDGDDRGKKVTVDQNWTIYGMDTEDTFGHFDTVDGKRIVTPSNRVKIYAPRFAAVRKLDGVYNARRNTRVNSFEKKLTMQVSRGKDFSSSTMQNVALNGMASTKRASGFDHRTRGVVTDQALRLIGTRNSFSAYENLELIKWGRHSNSETARLELGMQAANVWQDNLRLQVNAKGAQPIVVNDLSRVQQLVQVKSDGKGSVLRVTKVASKIAADQGDEVEFTIRFDNLSSKPVGNVTLVDNLTGRLQYVPDSAECSLKANFVTQLNEAGSLMLRWEITDPVKPHKGGIIRFKCTVR